MLGTTSIRRTSLAVFGALALTFTAIVSVSAADTYVVSPGDTLYSIAQRHGVSVDTIASMNGIGNPNLIYAGQHITLGSVNVGQTGGEQSSAPVSDSYTVQAGDTLWSIASRFGITVAQLVEANRNSVPDQNLIYPGQQLSIPGGAGGNVVAPPAQADPLPAPSQAAPSGDVGAMLHDTAVAYGVDPALVQAIAWQESGWQQHVVSSSGALGVMQVMPDTGGWVSAHLVGRPLDIGGSTSDNILAGVVYLEWLIRYTGNEEQALAAYYQGPGSLSRVGWYGETYTYVRNVQYIRSHFQLYGAPPR